MSHTRLWDLRRRNVEKTRRWRWGVNRWLVLLFVVLGIFAARAYAPVLPHVQLPAEVLSEQPLLTIPGVGEIFLTNTLVATLLADLILIFLAFVIRRAIKRGDLVLNGIAGAVEGILEALYNLAETSAGKWAKSIFPWMATIFMLVLVINWMELIPGVDSIGLLHQSEHGYPVEQIGQLGDTAIMTILPQSSEAAAETAGEHHESYGVIPFVRVASTDLNFTVALALIAVVMTQVFGVRALGLSYFSKFFNVKSLFTKPIFGVIDFAVGILEMVSEFSKIISFSFRLFGNIFAGSVLLFVIGSLVPVLAQAGFLMLEFFVGMIQAIVFGMLTMVFMSQATVGHGHEGEEH
ncbi:MAG: F0F1 ATP synthase subunit A [Anaerolineales bacterium]|nr:MAG: F0F1 ATP synthase subunit A [Anaerolineales bacterium]